MVDEEDCRVVNAEGGGLGAEATHDAVGLDHWLFAHTIVVDEASHGTTAPSVLWHVADSVKPAEHCSVACVGETCEKAAPRTSSGRGAVQPVGAVELCWQPTSGGDHCPLVHETDVDGGGGPNGLVVVVGAENPGLHPSVAAVPPD